MHRRVYKNHNVTWNVFAMSIGHVLTAEALLVSTKEIVVNLFAGETHMGSMARLLLAGKQCETLTVVAGASRLIKHFHTYSPDNIPKRTSQLCNG